MDLSVYISELLNEHGTISIPQIGVFKQVRKRGYYNADEGKLYPPYFQTEFEQQSASGEVLLKYLIEKSKVSPASAKYFLEKYVHNILQQAEIGEAMIGHLGWLSKDYSTDQLNFRPASNINVASAAFGFAPVSINNDGVPAPAHTTADLVSTPEHAAQTSFSESETEQSTLGEHTAPVTFSIEKELAETPRPTVKAEPAILQPKVPISPLVRQHKPADMPKPVTEPLATSPVPPLPPVVQPAEEPAVIDEVYEPAKPFYLKPWFYGVLVFAIITGGTILLLKNTSADKPSKSSTADPVVKSTPSMDSVVVKNTAPDTVVIKAQPVKDSVTKNQPLPPSTEFAPEVESPQATATHPVVNSNNYKFVLIGGSYGTYEQALAASNRYKAVGISASPFENSRKLFKVALGFYKTYTEGQQVKRELVKQGKVLNWKLYVETIRKK